LATGAVTVDAISGPQKWNAIREHYLAILESFGREIGVRHARKHLAAYAEDAQTTGYNVPLKLRERLVTTLEPSEVLEIFEVIFSSTSSEVAA
jgi:tRNA-dihydrouridine synthase